jgi:Pup amidohydrolase
VFVLQRLVGLETEYAIRLRPADAVVPGHRFRLYQQLTAALRHRVVTVRAHHFKEGVFTANGGAVWFESERPAAGSGLIEGATPECRGPHQLLVYQRAQDQLLSEAAGATDEQGGFQLIKNDRDAEDNVYGAQENYEAEIGRGFSLICWRAGLVLLFPLVLCYWIAFFLMVMLLLSYLAMAGMFYFLAHGLVRDRRKLALALFGRDLVEGRETGAPTPAWMEPVVLNITRVLSAPLALALYLHCRWFAFRRVRRGLTSFLLSRAVIGGSGMVDRQGRFHLADKAPALNCLVGFGGFLYDRPLFTMGHLFKALCVECLSSVRTYSSLFAERQRLQIGLGDSNMCEAAEYLRIGTTMLVLDLIESGGLPRPPVLRRPLQALRRLAADPTLRAEVHLADGRPVTALELQRFYLEACRRYLDRHPETTAEALDVLQRWEEALESLVEYKQQMEDRRETSPPQRLVGVLDWVTKYCLLQKLGPDATWAQKKKLDIRYHELSAEGYFQQLQAAGITTRLVTEEELDRARRLAPPESPATMRGHYIREFADSDEIVGVNWRCVVLGRGLRGKHIPLQQYGRKDRPRNRYTASPTRQA